uniref:Uncharacterized protein n=1 Tax=Pseudomonas phage HRDY3 TaxID=3236930 RepID=A0AB39CEP6_9VIRU
MGGSFGGMMMRVANSLGMGLPVYDAPRKSKRKSWAQRVEEETENELWQIRQDRVNNRDKAVNVFKHRLLDHYDQFYAAGLVKPGDTLMQIICRAQGVPYRKKRKRKS